MENLVLVLVLVQVSQHALAGVVEVNEGEESVLLPCQYSGIVPQHNPRVMWTRSDLSPRFVHQRGKEGDLKDQNQCYRGRTSMKTNALDSGDFSLTLRKPDLSDSSNYTCSITDGVQVRRVTDVHLKVKDHQLKVKVTEGAESVILPCRTTPDLPRDVTVEWTRSDPDFIIFIHTNTSREYMKHDNPYCGRTKMDDNLLRSGDVSLTLKYPKDGDTGSYICTIYRDEDILRQKVLVQVKAPFPSWATAVLILLVLLVLVLVSAGVFYHFRFYFISIPQEVESGVESVLLPCKTWKKLPGDAKVEWKDSNKDTVHVYQNGSDHPEDQHQDYRTRTEMKEDLLTSGDLSLTLKHPTDEDSQIFTCRVFRGKEKILKKQVELTVRVPQVEVESGVESVWLSCRTVHLPGDAKVEWRDDYNRTVHVYENGSDQLADQDQVYRTRTEMKEDLLTSGDLSLRLKHPTDGDSRTFTCRVSSRDGDILMVKQVKLTVRVPQVEVESGVESVLLSCRTTDPQKEVESGVESGVESVLLPCRTTDPQMEVESGVESVLLSRRTIHLPGDAKVEWTVRNRKVHVYENGSDQPADQDQSYRTRTEMKEDLLTSGDLSLTLKHPTDADSRIFTCRVSSRDGNILMVKQVKLTVRDCQVEVEEGAESVLLPFRTTEDLPGDATVEWKRYDPEPLMKVHVYKNGSDQPGDQDQVYRTRTKMMNPDPLKTGDLSLSLKRPRRGDSGGYRCRVWKGEDVMRMKTVQLKVKGTVQVQVPVQV